MTTNPTMTPIQAVVQGFRKYADFGGRATRAEFWRWGLFIVIGSIVCSVIDGLLGSRDAIETLFFLATLLPSLAVTTRRLHDIGKTGRRQLGWYGIIIGAVVVSGAMYLVGVVKEYSYTDASGGFHFDTSDVDWENSWEALASSFPPAIIVALAAMVIVLGVFVWSAIWMARQGESGQNRFGPDPR